MFHVGPAQDIDLGTYTRDLHMYKVEFQCFLGPLCHVGNIRPPHVIIAREIIFGLLHGHDMAIMSGS